MDYYFNKLIVCLLLLLTQTITYSQGDDYDPILDPNNVWTTIIAGGYDDDISSYDLTKYRLIGDTTINNVIYQKMYAVYGQTDFTLDDAQYLFAIRENGPKSYIVPKDDLSEYLYLDFSANAGDKFTIHTGNDLTELEVLSVAENDEGKLMLDLIRFSCFGDARINWIEGIGSTGGIAENLALCADFDSPIPTLLCLENDTATLYQIGVNCNAVYEFYPNFDEINDEAICLGQEITFTTDGVGGTFPYSIFVEPMSDAITIESIGAHSTATIKPTETTTYTITIQDVAGFTESKEVTIDVIQDEISVPEIKYFLEPGVCEFDSLNLYTEASYTNYWWTDFDGYVLGVNLGTIYGTDSVLTITEPLNYYLTVANASGCIESSFIEFSNGLDLNPRPEIMSNYSNDNDVCVGDVLKFWVSEPYEEYLWSTGEAADTVEIVITENTLQLVLDVTNAEGCTGNDSKNLDFDLGERPAVPTITFDGAKLIANSISDFVQWHLDGVPIVGATNAFYFPFYSGVYTVESFIEQGKCGAISENFVFNGFDITPELYLIVNLEGAYNAELGQMDNALLNLNVLPLDHPYRNSPYNYDGQEKVASYDKFPSNTVDWVLVEVGFLVEESFVLFDRRAGLLLSNGRIVDPQNFGNLRFDNLDNNKEYNFKIRHRNHLDIISSGSLAVNAVMSYDFQDRAWKAKGTDQLKEMSNGVFAIPVGDYIKDKVIQTTDYDHWYDSQTTEPTYNSADGNLDGIVDSLDYNLWIINRAKLGLD